MDQKVSIFFSERKVKFFLFLFILSILFFISGARLVSSDEVSMYLTVENIIKNGSFAIPFPDAPNSTTLDGKSYTWYEAGNIIAGIPMYLIGYGITSIISISPSLSTLIIKAAVSLTSAFVGAWIAIMFYSLSRYYGVTRRLSVGMAIALILTTFLLPYLKMFMREPILALCMIGGTGYIIRALKEKKSKDVIIAGIFIGYGILTKLAFVINLLPLGLYIFWKIFTGKNDMKFSVLLKFSIPIILIGFMGTGLYNFIRFSNPLNTGYAGGTSFNIPFYVGMFGLLFSPGKGMFWFAPLLLLIFPTINEFRKHHRDETYLIGGMFIVNLILSSVYIAWGGDGSWGPRYLSPFLPLFFLMIAFYLNRAQKIVKQFAITLTVLGFIVQIGGISIYAGAYLREIGEYPYQKNFDDPEFLSKAHFIPNYSPIIGHWKMLKRNIGEHLEGNYPRLGISQDTPDKRLPIGEEDRSKLLHTIDFWFTYGLSANIQGWIIIVGIVLLASSITVSAFGLQRSLSLKE
ncbi:MAG: hypothetical protein C0417_09875 [Chlorobiaceae bacterium]|nr:hypothetical protein [Chlorobiaceae bacterium]